MATQTRTLSLNAAFFQEVKADNRHLHRLLDRLEEICRDGRPHASRRRLFLLLEQLRDQLGFHFSLEEAYGYFDDAVDAAPWINLAAQRLRGQHEDLYREIDSLVEEAECLLHHEAPTHVAPHIACRFLEFHKHLQKHESEEIALIAAALCK